MTLKSKPSLDERGMVRHYPAERRTREEQAMWKIDSGLGAWQRNPRKKPQTSHTKPAKHRRKKELRVELDTPRIDEKQSVLMDFKQYVRGENDWFYHVHPLGFVIDVKTYDHKSWVAYVRGDVECVIIGKNHVFREKVANGLMAVAPNPQKALASLFGLKKWYFQTDGLRWTSAYDEHRLIHISLAWTKYGVVVPHKRTLPKKRVVHTLWERPEKVLFSQVEFKKSETPKPKYRELKDGVDTGQTRYTNEQIGSYSDSIGRL